MAALEDRLHFLPSMVYANCFFCWFYYDNCFCYCGHDRFCPLPCHHRASYSCLCYTAVFFFFFDNWKCLSLKSNYFPANGVLLCRLARKIDEGVAEWRYETRSSAPVGVPIHYHENAPPGSDTSCGAFVFVVIEPCSCC